MKQSVLAIFILLSQLTYGQQGDSVKKKAIELQYRGWQAALKKEYDKSLVLLDSSLALDSSRPEPFVLKAEALWSLNRYAEAAQTYKKYMAVKKPDYLIGAYVLLGMLYDKAQMRNQANVEYKNAIHIYESGYQPPRFDKTEEIEYVFAFGLMGNKRKWKDKLDALIRKYPSMNYQQFEKMSRKELLEFHFSPFGG